MMKKTMSIIVENGLLLITGAIVALMWANYHWEGYEAFTHYSILDNPCFGVTHDDYRSITLHWLVNDLLMVFFFALAGKEVFEAVALKNGSLNPPRKAITPIFATIGGVGMPVMVYFSLAWSLGELSNVANGWALPTATDIAFSLLVARMIFGKSHPAIAFLLLVAILDDLAGIMIIATFYPQGDLAPEFLSLVGAGIFICLILRSWKIDNFWAYLILGGIPSWMGLALSGLHPALGLLPIIPMLPHAESDIHVYARMKENQKDSLSHFEHAFKIPVEVILFLFGLLNAGVVLSNIGNPTFIVLGALLIGKPLGIFLFGTLAAKTYGLPNGMTKRHLWVIGCVASIGFTVSLFLAGAAFPHGFIQDAAKLGALCSFLGALVSFVFATILGVKKISSDSTSD